MPVTAAALSYAHLDPFVLADVEVDDPAPGEILVRIEASGICHTDLVNRVAGTTDRPVLLGHEGAGVVETIGPEVTSVRPGDRVVLTFRHCGACPNCEAGRPAYCRKAARLNNFGARADGSARVTVAGRVVLDGFFGQSSLAGYALTHADNTVVVDPDTDPVIAAPLGCGFQTGAGAVLNVLRPRPDSALVVFGAGAVGLAGVLAARAVDVATVLADAVAALAAGGAAVAVGLGTGVPDIDIRDLVMRGKSVHGCLEGDSIPATFIPYLLELHAGGRFPIERLVTAFPYRDVNAALQQQHSGEVIKPVLTW